MVGRMGRPECCGWTVRLGRAEWVFDGLEGRVGLERLVELGRVLISFLLFLYSFWLYIPFHVPFCLRCIPFLPAFLRRSTLYLSSV